MAVCPLGRKSIPPTLCPLPRAGSAEPRRREADLHAPPPPRPAPVIVAFGLKPERLVGAEGRIDAVPEPPLAEQAGLLMEALASGIKAGGAVIAIVPEWFAPEGLRRLEMARTLLDTARVAIHVTALPPLAATALPASHRPRPAPAERRPARERAPRAVRAAAPDHVARERDWTQAPGAEPRPACLEPDAGQRVRRLLAPRARRPQAPEGQASVPLPRIVRAEPPRDRARNGDEHWITGPVNAALGNLPLLRVEPTPGGQEYWGTSKVVEAVVVPADPDGLAHELLQTVDAWACRWCGELIARSPCPLCGHRARPRRRPAAASTGRPHVGRRLRARGRVLGSIDTSPRSK